MLSLFLQLYAERWGHRLCGIVVVVVVTVMAVVEVDEGGGGDIPTKSQVLSAAELLSF